MRFKTTDNGIVQLTSEEEAELNALATASANKLSELAQTKYQRNRAAEYPSINDYIDGVVKGDQAQIQAYIDACLAVKAKYPKP